MRVLLVGAGAVGQVYARHLQLGGAEVAFLVKPKYLEETRAGFTLFHLNRGRAPLRFEGFEVLTEPTGGFDAVILCVASPALRQGTWLADVCRATGDATIVTLQPNLDDPALVAKHAGSDRVVVGMIPFVSYHAPLPGEDLPPGTAYWIPPLAALPFSGTAERIAPLLAAFKRGGLRAKRHKDVGEQVAFAGALLGIHMVALERAGWSFQALRKDRSLLRAAHQASREAMAVVGRVRNQKVPLLLRAVGPTQIRMILCLTPRLAPVDLEAFYKVHFTKVAEQTRLQLATWRGLAEKLALPAPAIAMVDAWGPTPGASPS